MSDVVFGIDFSGSKNAGDSIWLTQAESCEQDWRIEKCLSARDEAGRRRDLVYGWLIKMINNIEPIAVGLDFTFGLPAWALTAESWRARLDEVNDWDSPDAMRSHCLERLPEAGHDRRKTESKHIGGLRGYGWLLKTQTYYGLTEFLPLLLEKTDAVVKPMDESNAPTMAIEVYPGATLAELDLEREGYKQERASHYDTRERNLDGLVGQGYHLDSEVRRNALCNDDALDSVVAAVATARAVENDFAVEEERYDPLEGYIYA
ncbi:DUF429 domain-containing protein [Halosegnis longus]|uniref:DUF429 domain-containing protein n=1 Tax=Halosegnis longus TaxID=2216012 RepID=UPI00096A6917|nr:DUF429 domain-containing protein [Salella cibi]